MREGGHAVDRGLEGDEKTACFGAERLHKTNITGDLAFTSSDDNFGVGGDDPCVSSDMGMASIAGENRYSHWSKMFSRVPGLLILIVHSVS